MSDTTLCSGKNCPLSSKCFRFLYKSNSERQSYFVEPPYDKVKKDCEYFYDRKL